jgi:gas vesicle protein
MSDTFTLVGLLGSPVVGAVAAILVARIQTRKATKTEIAEAVAEQTKALMARLAAAEAVLAKIDGEERDDIAKLKEDLVALGDDVGELHASVERRWKSDDARRERAGRQALEDREKLHEHLATLREKVAGMAGAMQTIRERGPHA